MGTVGTRELKQNPHAVVQRVLDSGEPLEVTSHGHPTGVRLVRDAPDRRAWVGGGDLLRLTPLEPDAVQRWHDDLAEISDGDVVDPWEPSA